MAELQVARIDEVNFVHLEEIVLYITMHLTFGVKEKLPLVRRNICSTIFFWFFRV